MAFSQSHLAAAQERCDPSLSHAITDTTIVDVVAGRRRPHQTIIISCGRITAIGPSHQVNVPVGMPVIEGKGLYAAPGLVDAHAHNTAIDSFRRAFLAYGVTTVRNMSGDAASIDAIRQVSSGAAPGPFVYLAGPIINGSEPEWKKLDIAAASQAIAAATKSLGGEYVKAYYQLTPAQFDALAVAASQLNMPLVGHVPRSVSLDHALKQMWSIEHLTGFDDTLEEPTRHVEGRGSAMLSLRRFAAADYKRIPVLAGQVASSSVWQVPTLFTYDVWTRPAEMQRLASDPAIQVMAGENMLKEWTTPNPWYVTPIEKQTEADRTAIAGAAQVRRLMVKALYDAGANLAIGTDAGEVFVAPGLSFHQEMKIYSEIGIPAAAILRMATINGAKVSRHEDEFGTLDAGKRADVLLLRANPLKDIRTLEKPVSVIAAGRYYNREALDTFAGAATRSNVPSAY